MQTPEEGAFKLFTEGFAPIIMEIDLEDPQFTEDNYLIAKVIESDRWAYADQPPMKLGLVDPADSGYFIISSRYTFDILDISHGYYWRLDAKPARPASSDWLLQIGQVQIVTREADGERTVFMSLLKAGSSTKSAHYKLLFVELVKVGGEN